MELLIIFCYLFGIVNNNLLGQVFSPDLFNISSIKHLLSETVSSNMLDSKAGSSAEDEKAENFFVAMLPQKIPFFGSIMKYFKEMNDDIHDYSYVLGPSGEHQPSFCGHHECQNFTLICKNDYYEVRRYPAMNVIKTTTKGSILKWGYLEGIYKLFKYARGRNNKDATFPMTVPIMVEENRKMLSKSKGISITEPLNESLVVMLSLPSKYKDNTDTPLPSDPQLHYGKYPDNVVYVKMFTGFALPWTWSEKAQSLIKALVRHNQNITDKAYLAYYNKPSQIFDRHNEIMFQAKEIKTDVSYCHNLI
ncbi:unnamed protein product [Gordionus sp. m RMFG-2023]|uniref:heme-binding protein 2-like n=1 Tax=Gordionus sp. m RMFG-2023 TaxID=3053472 RepID=UPI0030DE85CC